MAMEDDGDRKIKDLKKKYYKFYRKFGMGQKSTNDNITILHNIYPLIKVIIAGVLGYYVALNYNQLYEYAANKYEQFISFKSENFDDSSTEESNIHVYDISINSDPSRIHFSISSGSRDGNPDAAVAKAVAKAGTYLDRQINYKIWHPSDEGEWRDIGKFAIIKLSVSSADESEIPLKSVYVIKNGIRKEFKMIYAFSEGRDKSPTFEGYPLYFRSTYFYLVPTYYIKNQETIISDFAKNRDGFTIGSAKYVPSFYMYSNEDEESLDVLKRNINKFKIIIKREYPEYADKFE
jgi:hypothetical protein